MTSDAELLARYARDDSQAAFAEFVERNADLVYTLALRRLGNDPARAEQVTQAVFVVAAQKADTLSGRRGIVAWLHQSCASTANQLIRSEQRRTQKEARGAAQTSAVPGAAIPDALLDETVELLPEQEQAALLLRHYCAKTTAEIALQLDLSEEISRVRAERGFERVRESFERLGLGASGAALTAALGSVKLGRAPSELAGTIPPVASAAAAANRAPVFQRRILGRLGFWKAAWGITALLAVGAAVVSVHESSLAAFRQTQVADARRQLESTYDELSEMRLQLVRERTRVGESERETALLLAAIEAEQQASDLAAADATNEAAVTRRFSDAHAMAKAGKHEAALEEYLWCFDTGMRQHPALAGLRNGYLLTALAELAQTYAPARAALTERRTAAEQALQADPLDKDAAVDFAALNRGLNEPQRTLAFFDRLSADDPRRTALGFEVRDQLISRGRYADAAKVYPYHAMQLRLSTFSSLETTLASSSPPETRSRLLREGRAQAVREAGKGIEILVGAGETERARLLARQLMELDDTTDTRALIERHAQRAGLQQLLP